MTDATPAEPTSGQTRDLSRARDMIVCEDVSKWYGDFRALDKVSATIKEQEVVVVLGPDIDRAGGVAGLVDREDEMPAAEHPRREGGGLLGAEVDGTGGVEVERVQPAQRDGVVGERVQLQMSHARGESVVIPFALEPCLGQHRAAGLGYLLYLGEQLAHARAAPDHAVKLPLIQQALVVAQLLLQLLALQSAGDGQGEVVQVQGFGQKIIAAYLKRMKMLIDVGFCR